MRLGIVGAGIAGSLLAWRLAQEWPGSDVELLCEEIPGAKGGGDATAWSGGLLRGFEPDLLSAEMAADSLKRLRAVPALAAWSQYREIGAVYLSADTPRRDLAPRVAAIRKRLPGSVRIVTAEELTTAHGWAGVPADSLAVAERAAGYGSLAGLREQLLLELARSDVLVGGGTVTHVRPGSQGGVVCQIGPARRHYDAVVLAVGRWTPALLTRSGLPADAYRTKLIQYGIYHSDGMDLPTFVDETTGLYGRAAQDDHVLLGVATDSWDVAPDQPTPDPESQERARELATARFPALRVGALEKFVSSADAYTSTRRLALRRVPADGRRLFTFTGGSGGAAKTSLAASRKAAQQLRRALDRSDLATKDGR